MAVDTAISYFKQYCVVVIRVLINIPQLLISMNRIGFQQEKNSFVKLVKQMHYDLFGYSLSGVRHQYNTREITVTTHLKAFVDHF